MSVQSRKIPVLFNLLEPDTYFSYSCYFKNKDIAKKLFDACYFVWNKEKDKDIAEIVELIPESKIVRKLKVYKNGKVLEFHERESDYPCQVNGFWIFLRWIDINEIKIGEKKTCVGPMPYREVISQEDLGPHLVYRCKEYGSNNYYAYSFYHKTTGLLLKTVCGSHVVELKSTNLPQLPDYWTKPSSTSHLFERRFIHSLVHHLL